MNITIPTLPLTYIEQPIIDNITDDDDHNISSVVEVLETPRQRRGSRSSSEMAAPPSARQSSVGEALRRINSPRPVANSINHKTNSGNTSCSPVIIPHNQLPKIQTTIVTPLTTATKKNKTFRIIPMKQNIPTLPYLPQLLFDTLLRQRQQQQLLLHPSHPPTPTPTPTLITKPKTRHNHHSNPRLPP